ncbi:hypothetical protein HII36_27435 [Nonomuraea sp. NN258]|uniref:hypothetical protein n=1 Tax=Nonomuraea antri TaxID=2730852 RepID=UPI0015692BA7|nr:hypothetical protein [Nonomuraea antri]NRQ35536.1 hypothetical protein [Nonomuraea antri]
MSTASPSFRYPYVIGWTGEAEQPAVLRWRPRSDADGQELAYTAPDPGDYQLGVLLLRQGQRRTGRPDFKSVNTRRQWRCMTKLLCQVCAKSAMDSETGRVWWLLSGPGGPVGDGYTNAPPTCPACIPEAIASCSFLRRHAAVFTVGSCRPYGVRADVFLPGRSPSEPWKENEILRLRDPDIPHCVARELLMGLSDVRPTRLYGDLSCVA